MGGSGRDLDRLLRMQAARSGKHDDIRIGVRKKFGEAGIALCPSSPGRGGQRRWIHVADGNELGAVAELLERGEVVLGDAPAAHESEARLAVGDRRLVFNHLI